MISATIKPVQSLFKMEIQAIAAADKISIEIFYTLLRTKRGGDYQLFFRTWKKWRELVAEILFFNSQK